MPPFKVARRDAGLSAAKRKGLREKLAHDLFLRKAFSATNNSQTRICR